MKQSKKQLWLWMVGPFISDCLHPRNDGRCLLRLFEQTTWHKLLHAGGSDDELPLVVLNPHVYSAVLLTGWRDRGAVVWLANRPHPPEDVLQRHDAMYGE